MKDFVIPAAAAFALVVTASVAHAGPIRHRQHDQAARIHQGVTSGSLTAGEARALRSEQRAINHARGHALSDGRVDPREANALTRAQNRASRHIYRLEHNHRSVSE